jgi:hypothetical protein
MVSYDDVSIKVFHRRLNELLAKSSGREEVDILTTVYDITKVNYRLNIVLT